MLREGPNSLENNTGCQSENVSAQQLQKTSREEVRLG